MPVLNRDFSQFVMVINQMSSLPDDGTIYPKYHSAVHRFALNATNYFDKGYTKDLVFVIDGNEYRL